MNNNSHNRVAPGIDYLPPRRPYAVRDRDEVEDVRRPTADLTAGHLNHGACRDYSGFEINIARYAVTLLAHSLKDVSVGRPARLDDGPGTATIPTDAHGRTRVYNDVSMVSSEGAVTAVMDSQTRTYYVSFAAPTREKLDALMRRFDSLLERTNPFRGKLLRFACDRIEFMQCPTTRLQDVIAPEWIVRDFRLNVIEFLLHPDSFAPLKKRGILLSGPPGVGKSSLVSAAIHELRDSGVTCALVGEEFFDGSWSDLSTLFQFVHTYLSPCLVIFEDIDLIGADRDMERRRGMIGSLLTALNGIEDAPKPVVIVATTNRPDILDKALTRPCRLDRHYRMEAASAEEVGKLFRAITGGEPPSKLLDGRTVTGAHVREIHNTAILLAGQKGGKAEEHFEEAIDVVLAAFHLSQPVPLGIRGVDEDE